MHESTQGTCIMPCKPHRTLDDFRTCGLARGVEAKFLGSRLGWWAVCGFLWYGSPLNYQLFNKKNMIDFSGSSQTICLDRRRVTTSNTILLQFLLFSCDTITSEAVVRFPLSFGKLQKPCGNSRIPTGVNRAVRHISHIFDMSNPRGISFLFGCQHQRWQRFRFRFGCGSAPQENRFHFLGSTGKPVLPPDSVPPTNRNRFAVLVSQTKRNPQISSLLQHLVFQEKSHFFCGQRVMFVDGRTDKEARAATAPKRFRMTLIAHKSLQLCCRRYFYCGQVARNPA